MTEQPSEGSLPNTKAVCLQAHRLSGSSSWSSSGVLIQSRRVLHLHLQTEQPSRQPRQQQSAGLHQHVDVTVAFIATGACCLNKSLFLWLQLEGDTLHALLSSFIWLETMLNSRQKQIVLLRTSASATGAIFLLTSEREKIRPPPNETANNQSHVIAKKEENVKDKVLISV